MNYIVSFQKMVTRLSRCGGMTSGSSSRLLEDVVKLEDAVEFKDGPDLVSQQLVARRSVSSAGANQENLRDGTDVEYRGQRDGQVVQSGGGEEEFCPEHLSVLLKYWCEDDTKLVCEECLIFGEHRGHRALKREQRRSDNMARLATLLSSMQVELEMTEMAGRQVEVEGMDQLKIVKSAVTRWLDERWMEEKNKVTSQLSERISRLRESINSIQLNNTMDHPASDTVTSLLADPVMLTMVPSTVVKKDTQLVVTQPRISLTGGEAVYSSSDLDTSNTDPQSPPTSSPLQFNTSSSLRSSPVDNIEPPGCHNSPPIRPLDLAVLDGGTVTVMKNGTPRQFYCRADGGRAREKLEKLLDMAFESRIFPPSPGQGVLARWDGAWCRATVLDSVMAGWRCELVDLGQVVTVVTLEIADLPPSVLEMPALSACCSLGGGQEVEWAEEAREDWERLVRGKQFTLCVEDYSSRSVNLLQGELKMVDRLRFLGHLTAVLDTISPSQHFSSPGALSSAAYLCLDYDQISPDSILLYFDNQHLSPQLQLLEQLDAHPDLVGPPGDVQPGHAVLAPWESSLYRATVLSMTGTTLTLLYVDHGNTDLASWWDCYTVHTDLLFPPLATEVRLAGVRSVERGSWTKESCHRLSQVLSKTSEKVKVVVESSSHGGGAVEVELFVRDGGQQQNVLQLLVDEGFACGDEQLGDALPVCMINSDGGDNGKCELEEEREPVLNAHQLPKEEYLHDLELGVGKTKRMTGPMDDSEVDQWVNNRVYMTGSFPSSMTELDLATWAEHLWGEVDMVKIGYNQVVIDFHSRESADMCSRQGKAAIGSSQIEIFPFKLSFQNGVHVTDLLPVSRRSDVSNIFTKFGEIAFIHIQGPFAIITGPASSKTAVVVFKDYQVLKKVLESGEVKQRGKQLTVQKNTLGRRSQGFLNSKLTNNKGDPSENKSQVPPFTEDVEVEVLHVDSPEQVWVRLAEDMDRWTQFHQVVQEVGRNKVVEMGSGAELEVGQKVICRVEGAWYRGRVVGGDLVKTCRVKLVDLGEVVDVDRENVGILDHPYILKEKVLVRSVQLGGLEPAGSGGWSGSSVDFLIRWTRKRKVFLVKKEDESEDLMVEEVSASNPTDVETVSRISLSAMLLQRGLALRINTRRKCENSWAEFVNEGPVVNLDEENESKEILELKKEGVKD